MRVQPLDEEAIFKVACGIESPEVRQDYLKQACGEDAALFDRVATLLRAHDEDPSFLESPVSDAAPTLDIAIAELPGTTVGRYKLLEEIGEGGMGVVFMAEQREPVRRKVALKIIKPGMDTRQVIGRFEAERQALAMMDHPIIAHVFDGGATESGRPYFVMELVRGMPITQYCDEAKLTTAERLQLFSLVCDAVQHAHQKGIIHRDIKPRNVLVTLHGETPVPKIIDFGVAKATHGQLTEKTVFTGFGQMIGTPAYMSPEQVAISGLDVDTRSDIYSLGVLLYELLTGVPPFDKDRFRELTYDEIRDVIREEEPPRPSTRISTLAAEATSTISTNRKTDSTRLSHSLRGELDWIVMKSLEKDRTRRYESANEMAKDVQRHLDGEAVEACPPSAWYRLRKYAKRRKALLTTAALLAATMLAATGVSVSFAIQANAEKEKAIAAQKLADQRLAQSRLDFERALRALDTVVEEVSSPEFAQIPGVEKIRSEVLERMLTLYEAIAEEHDDDPYARQQQALAYKRISHILQVSHQHEEALTALNQGIAILEELLQASPGDKGLKLQLSKLLSFRVHLAQTRTREERLKDAQRALTLYEELVESGSHEHIGAVALLHVSVAHLLPEDSPRAVEHLADSIRIPEQNGLTPHSGSYIELAKRAEKKGDYAEAEENYRRGIELTRPSAEGGGPIGRRWLSFYCSKFARLLNSLGRSDEAREFHLESIEVARQLRREYGNVEWYGSSLSDSVLWYVRDAKTEKQKEDAAGLITELAELQPEKALHSYWAALVSLGGGSSDSYGSTCRRMLKQFQDTEKANDAYWVAWTCLLGPEAAEDYAPVVRLAEQAVEADADSEVYLKTLGGILYRAGRFEEAVKRLTEADNLIEDPDTESNLSPAYTWYFLAMAHHKLGHAEEAKKWLDKATEWTDKVLAEHEEGKSPLSWNRRLTLKLLRKEAEDMIGNEEG